MEQLKAANEQIARQSVHIADITSQLKEALARLESIEQSFKAKDDSLKKEKRKNKGLTKIIRNEGEQQPSNESSEATTEPDATSI